MKRLLERYFNFIKGFIPSEPQTTSIGLEITQNECKMVEVKKSSNGFQVVRWAIESLDENKPVNTIKAILPSDLTQASVHTAVNGKGTLIRYIEMPRMTVDELRNSFALESDKYFPFAQDQIYTDCYILDPTGKTKQMDVMAAASTKDLIDNRLKLMNEAGVQTDFIGINSVALANVINALGYELQDAKPEMTYVLVDIGESVSNVTIMINKFPRFSRDIFIGGRDFIKRISNAFGKSSKEARALCAEPSEKAKEIISACESIFLNMTQELRLSFDYFSTERNKEVDKIYLTGDYALLPGIKQALEEHLELKVELWNPFNQLTYVPDISKEDIQKNAHRLTVALGLSLYNYD
ncbi:MAG TPA: type IV pilus assembly protein PilM [Candidatus Omnitrophota bacterium]|nr:type IV pilus assembly protein PilM [Candidatus Omnitrophota bacterium]